jgi:hypothetical protein
MRMRMRMRNNKIQEAQEADYDVAHVHISF